MAAQLPIANVKRLVLYEQADDLAVCHVDERLAGLGIAIAGLGVRERAHLVEAGQVGARQTAWLTLVEVPAQADVPVGERKHGLCLRELAEVELGLANRPWLDRKRWMLDHEASSRSARSETTTSAP